MYGLEKTFGKNKRKYTLIYLSETKEKAIEKKNKVKDKFFVRIEDAPEKYRGNYMVWRSIEKKKGN